MISSVSQAAASTPYALVASAAGHSASIAQGAAAAASAASASDWWSSVKPVTPDAVANGFSTLVGALLGAMLAFTLQYWFARRVEKKSAKSSAHKILFFLFQQINTILMIQRDFVHSNRTSPLRAITIPATLDFEPERDIVDYGSFSFLIESKDSRAILYDLWLAQQSYTEAIRAWNVRSQFHNREVQPRLAGKIENGSLVSMAQVKDALGATVLETITNYTDAVLLSLKHAFEKLSAANGNFREYVVKEFNSQDFTRFECPEIWGILSNDEPPETPTAQYPGGSVFSPKSYYKNDGSIIFKYKPLNKNSLPPAD